MAGDVARAAAVSVRLRHAVAGRAVQRLLVLGGLLIAGWLLGCAAQSAHAAELPPAPADVVARTPVLRQAVAIVHEREPVRRVVRVVAEKAPQPVLEKAPLQVRKVAAPPVTKRHAAPVPKRQAVPRAVEVAPVPEVRPRPHDPGVSKVSPVRSAAAHVTHHAVQRHPMPAPERPGGHSAAGGLVAGGMTAVFPSAGAWAPAPPRAALPRVSGAIPPVVRTAAGEPFFAPD